MRARFWQLPLYPVLVAPLWALFLWSSAPDAVATLDGLVQTGLAAVVAGASLALMSARMGWWRAGLAATLAAVAVTWPVPLVVSLGLLVPATAVLAVLPRASPEPFDLRAASFANGLAATLLVTTGAGLATRALAVRRADPPAPIAVPGAARPDIWWILLDGHARPDWLARRFGVDDALGPGLAARGFQVPPASRANYCQTLYAVASTLDLAPVGADATRERVEELLRSATFPATLRALGYRTVFWPGGYHRLDPAFDEERRAVFAPTEYHLEILTRMMPVRLGELASRRSIAADARHAFTVRSLAAVAPEVEGAPAFHLVHVVSPHPPFVAGPAGEAAPTGDAARLFDASDWHNRNPGADYRDGYARQVRWLQPQVLAAVDRLIAGRPAVVVVSSDHGSGLGLDWNDPGGEALAERLSSFWAIHLPVEPRARVPDTMSPVNTFRYVLDEVFGTSLGLLPDRSNRQTWGEPEKLTDVTDEVHR